MQSILQQLLACLLACGLALGANAAYADSVPDVLHYRFDGSGVGVPNLASTPPAGTQTAAIMGSVSQTGTDLNYGGGGNSLSGSGLAASTDYLNTNWAPDLGGGSWTISFVASGIGSSTTLYYVFGDANTNSFRCFTNGVAGSGNWILRGAGLADVLLPGGATGTASRTTFVYDASLAVVRGYLDGVLVAEVPQTPGAVQLTGAGPFKVMGYATNIGAPAGGLLDDFRLYSRALSIEEVAVIDTHPILAVSGNGTPIENQDTTPSPADHTDFGDVAVATGTVVRTLTLLNSGNSALVVDDVTLTGAHAADFSVTQMPASPLAVGDSTTLQITFDPSGAGIRAATVTIDSNAIGANALVFDIQGTGLSPQIAVSGNAVDIANGDITPDIADHTDFGTTLINAGPLVRSFSIDNIGNASMEIASVTIAGVHAEDFSVTTVPATSLPAGTGSSFTVAFSTTTAGVRNAVVSIANDDPNANPFTFAIQGTGMAADVQVSKSNFTHGVVPGQDTTYTIQVRNAGPANVSAVRIVDNVAGASFTNAQWTCTSEPAGLCPSLSGNGDIDQTTGLLSADALLEYTLIATPLGTAPGSVSNTVTASNLDGSDPDGSNNTATDTDVILPFGIFIDGFEDVGLQLLRPSIAR